MIIPGLQDLFIFLGVYAIGVGSVLIYFLMRWTFNSFKQENDDIRNEGYNDGYDEGFNEATRQMQCRVREAYIHGRLDRPQTPLFDQDKE